MVLLSTLCPGGAGSISGSMLTGSYWETSIQRWTSGNRQLSGWAQIWEYNSLFLPLNPSCKGQIITCGVCYNSAFFKFWLPSMSLFLKLFPEPNVMFLFIREFPCADFNEVLWPIPWHDLVKSITAVIILAISEKSGLDLFVKKTEDKPVGLASASEYQNVPDSQPFFIIAESLVSGLLLTRPVNPERSSSVLRFSTNSACILSYSSGVSAISSTAWFVSQVGVLINSTGRAHAYLRLTRAVIFQFLSTKMLFGWRSVKDKANGPRQNFRWKNEGRVACMAVKADAWYI